MVAKVKFWLLESSRLIAKASFSVMILKSLFLYSLFITRPFEFLTFWSDTLAIPKHDV